MKIQSQFDKKATGLLNSLDLKKKRYQVLYWIMFALLIALSLVCLVPTIWIFLSGFKTPEEMYAIPASFFPKEIRLSKIADVWNKVSVYRYFINSVILIVGCLMVDIIVNGLCGYVLSRLKPSGSKIVDRVIFWSLLLPGISLVPLYMTFVDMPVIHTNMVGSYFPIWMMAGANAFNVLLFKNFFNGISISYIEAAKIDGYSDLKIFFKIIVPLSTPIIMTVSIFSITGTWGNFMWPYLILGNTLKEPVAVMLYQLKSGGALGHDEYMLVLSMSILPMFIVYFFFSKRIVGGVNVGGVKG